MVACSPQVVMAKDVGKFPVNQSWPLRRCAAGCWEMKKSCRNQPKTHNSQSSKLQVPTRNRAGLVAKNPRRNIRDQSAVRPQGLEQRQSSKSFPAPFLLSPPSQFWRKQRKLRGDGRKTEAPSEEKETQQPTALLTPGAS